MDTLRELERQFITRQDPESLVALLQYRRQARLPLVPELLSKAIELDILSSIEVRLPGDELDGLDHITSCSWSPDGELLAVGCSNGIIYIIDLSGQIVRKLLYNISSEQARARHDERIENFNLQCVWAPDGKSLVSFQGSQNPVAVIWSRSGKKLRTLLNPDLIYCCDWTPDGKILAVGSYGGNGSIILWMRGGKKIAIIAGHKDLFECKWSPDGMLLAFSDSDSAGGVKIVDRTGVLVKVINQVGVRCVDWSPDGRLLAYGTDRGFLAFWDRQQDSITVLDEVDRSSPITRPWYSGCAWSPQDHILATRNERQHENILSLWTFTDETVQRTAQPLEDEIMGARCYGWSPDGQIFLLGSLWSKEGQKLTGPLPCATWSPKGDMLAVWRKKHPRRTGGHVFKIQAMWP